MWVYEASTRQPDNLLPLSSVNSPDMIPDRRAVDALRFSDEETAACAASTNSISFVPSGRHAHPASSAMPVSRTAAENRPDFPHPFKYCVTRYFSAYFIGLPGAGVLVSLCSADKLRYLQYYTANWLAPFSAATPQRLFGTLFLTQVLSMTVLLLTGLCAFGTPLIYLFLMLKSIGSGILSVILFLSFGWKGMLLYLIFPAPVDLISAWCLCRLSPSAAKGSRGISRRCMASADAVHTSVLDFQPLLSRYLLLCVLQILSCGISAALAAPSTELALNLLQ